MIFRIWSELACLELRICIQVYFKLSAFFSRSNGMPLSLRISFENRYVALYVVLTSVETGRLLSHTEAFLVVLTGILPPFDFF